MAEDSNNYQYTVTLDRNGLYSDPDNPVVVKGGAQTTGESNATWQNTLDREQDVYVQLLFYIYRMINISVILW